jgi:hypothetical protein
MMQRGIISAAKRIGSSINTPGGGARATLRMASSRSPPPRRSNSFLPPRFSVNSFLKIQHHQLLAVQRHQPLADSASSAPGSSAPSASCRFSILSHIQISNMLSSHKNTMRSGVSCTMWEPIKIPPIRQASFDGGGADEDPRRSIAAGADEDSRRSIAAGAGEDQRSAAGGSREGDSPDYEETLSTPYFAPCDTCAS